MPSKPRLVNLLLPEELTPARYLALAAGLAASSCPAPDFSRTAAPIVQGASPHRQPSIPAGLWP